MKRLVGLVNEGLPETILEMSSEQIEETLQTDVLQCDDEWISRRSKNATIYETDVKSFIDLIRDVVQACFLPGSTIRYRSSMFYKRLVPNPWWVMVLEVIPEGKLEGVNQRSRYSEMAFDAQPGRLFVPAAVLAEIYISLLIFDRSEIFASEEISIHSNYQKSRGVEYKVNCICNEFGIKGRTVCYHGISQADESEVIIKEFWDDVDRQETEVSILKKLNKRKPEELYTPDGVRIIPEILSHEVKKTARPDVITGEWVNVDAMTALFRRDLIEWDGDESKWAWSSANAETRNTIEIRRLCRIVMKPFGQKLHTFTSKKVLMKAFGDVMQGSSLYKNEVSSSLTCAVHPVIRILYEKGIIHRDISFHSILLHKQNGATRGLLVNYEYAVPTERATYTSVRERTVIFVPTFILFPGS